MSSRAHAHAWMTCSVPVGGPSPTPKLPESHTCPVPAMQGKADTQRAEVAFELASLLFLLHRKSHAASDGADFAHEC
jgi:hypothetical protein